MGIDTNAYAERFQKMSYFCSCYQHYFICARIFRALDHNTKNATPKKKSLPLSNIVKHPE